MATVGLQRSSLRGAGRGRRLLGQCRQLAAEVLRSSDEGLLLLPGQAASDSAAPRRGSVLRHEGRWWLCAFEVDRYWFASPLCDAGPKGAEEGEGQLLCRRSAVLGSLEQKGAWPKSAVACLRRPTPLQAERAPLSHGLPTGLAALDVLSPLGLGQSLLVAGGKGSGKSTLAREVLEQVLTTRPADKVFRFSTDPCVPLMGAALQRRGALSELTLSPHAPQSAASLVAPLFAAVGAAENARDAGEDALLVLDTVDPLLSAWNLAAEWAAAERGDGPLDPELAAAQRRALLANLFERASRLRRGGSLTLLALAESEALAAVAGPAAPSDSVAGKKAFELSDFAGRKASELERLEKLAKRSIPLTKEVLETVGIAPPSRAETREEAAAREHSSVMREMQSLSDGQVVLDLAAASAGDFPSVVPGATFSRFGLGSSSSSSGPRAPLAEKERRDVRPPALQAVAAHLRNNLALEKEARFRPSSGPEMATQAAHMRAVRAALLQPPRAPLQPEETTALLLLACSGALSQLPEEEIALALRGGAASPLLLHLQEAAPGLLKRLTTQERLSDSDLRPLVRELEVSARVFVALRKAELASKAQ